MILPETEINAMSALALAHMGDAVYELKVRTFLLQQTDGNVNSLHRLASRFVSASAQSKLMETMEILMALEQCQMTYNLGKYNDAVTAAMDLIQQQGERLAAYESAAFEIESNPAADDKPLEKVIKLLQREYQRAKKMEFVHKPLAYALYKVWRMADGGK